jgi:hypothetical protein
VVNACGLDVGCCYKRLIYLDTEAVEGLPLPLSAPFPSLVPRSLPARHMGELKGQPR